MGEEEEEEEEEQGRLTGGILPGTDYPALQGNRGIDSGNLPANQSPPLETSFVTSGSEDLGNFPGNQSEAAAVKETWSSRFREGH